MCPPPVPPGEAPPGQSHQPDLQHLLHGQHADTRHHSKVQKAQQIGTFSIKEKTTNGELFWLFSDWAGRKQSLSSNRWLTAKTSGDHNTKTSS